MGLKPLVEFKRNANKRIIGLYGFGYAKDFKNFNTKPEEDFIHD